jgi:glycosyltransferase involved in cell wall biosynthesis
MPKGQGRAYGRVPLVLALSEEVAARLRAENPRLAARIAAFPFPIDWQQLAAAKAHAALSAPVTIGFIGRVHPEKGVRLLLAAGARLAARSDLPAWRLEITGPVSVPAGGGGEAFRDRLVTEFSSTLGERLVFRAPEFNSANLARRYGATDIFCYPSLADRGETFGVAVAEAMAAGAAPVVSDLACFRELVRDGDTGLVFDHTASDAEVRLADAIARLLLDPNARQAMATRAQEHVRRFDFARCAHTVLADLNRIVAP